MAGLRGIDASNCDPNSPLLTKFTTDSLISYQSSSIKPSMRSSTSRITLVGYDEDLEPTIDILQGTASKEWSWFDHFLAVLCINKKPKPQANASYWRAEPEDREMRFDRCPWILPVYVLSTERDGYRHIIPKEAKCTIDTGNLQGNIVSKFFLINVLGHAETDFHKLTKEEENGGTGITGHKFVPQGAINLTWYHSNSTRVFRDMRFLISEPPMYDLIIGARSIQEHNILDVPNLMSGVEGKPNPRYDQEPEPRSDELDDLEFKKSTAVQAKTKWDDLKDDEELIGTASYATLQNREHSIQEVKRTTELYEEELEYVYQKAVEQAKSKKDTAGVLKLRALFKDKTERDLKDGPPRRESKKEK